MVLNSPINSPSTRDDDLCIAPPPLKSCDILGGGGTEQKGSVLDRWPRIVAQILQCKVYKRQSYEAEGNSYL